MFVFRRIADKSICIWSNTVKPLFWYSLTSKEEEEEDFA